jgi:hypothetical protein
MAYVRPRLSFLGEVREMFGFLNGHKVGPPLELPSSEPGHNPPAYELDE